MNKTGYRSLPVVMVTLLAALFVFAAPASATPAGDGGAVVVSEVEMINAGLADCDAGEVCFWTESNYTGRMCHWDGSDDNWYAGVDVCSWTNTSPAKSVYNHGMSTTYKSVYFYRGVNYTVYNGCMGRGWSGNIGPAYLRSHIWSTVAC